MPLKERRWPILGSISGTCGRGTELVDGTPDTTDGVWPPTVREDEARSPVTYVIGRTRELLLLGGVMLALGFLWGRGRHVSYWLDEGISVGIAFHPMAEIPQLLRNTGRHRCTDLGGRLGEAG